MNIKFKYSNKHVCNLNDKKTGHWGCCCQCQNQLEVRDYFYSGERKSLGFFICLLFHVMEGADWVDLTGKHGVCEGFKRR